MPATRPAPHWTSRSGSSGPFRPPSALVSSSLERPSGPFLPAPGRCSAQSTSHPRTKCRPSQRRRVHEVMANGSGGRERLRNAGDGEERVRSENDREELSEPDQAEEDLRDPRDPARMRSDRPAPGPSLAGLFVMTCINTAWLQVVTRSPSRTRQGCRASSPVRRRPSPLRDPFGERCRPD